MSSNTELVIDTDVIIHKTNAESALGDMYGAFVFQDEFIEQEMLYKQMQKERTDGYVSVVLLCKEDIRAYEDTVSLVLKQDTTSYVKDIRTKQDSSLWFTWAMAIMCSICLLCMLIRINDRKKKRANHSYSRE